MRYKAWRSNTDKELQLICHEDDGHHAQDLAALLAAPTLTNHQTNNLYGVLHWRFHRCLVTTPVGHSHWGGPRQRHRLGDNRGRCPSGHSEGCPTRWSLVKVGILKQVRDG